MNLLQLECQRDLYKLLLTISHDNPDNLDSVITSALELIVKITNASIGYIQIEDLSSELHWSTYHCPDNEVIEIKKRISSGIIAEALESGETVITQAAYLDPRFRTRQSVQDGTIQSVLCAPIQRGDNYIGIIYLEGNASFNSQDKNNLMEANMFSKHISPLLSKLKSKIEHSLDEENLFKTHNLTNIIGRDPSFLNVLKEAMSLASLNTTILITGKTGTGKTQIAKAIHQNSSRKNGPFIHLNCANFPEQLVESELFGSVKGAHSIAYTDIKGKIAAADKGTLFLDEIGELPVHIQAKFLHFLEEGYFFPLGGTKPVSPDIRILVASNIDFEKAIIEKIFRADLYYRINVFSLELPPLHKRKTDIFPLVNFFIAKYAYQYNFATVRVGLQALVLLEQYDWPGNIRQLENLTQQALVRATREQASTLKMHHFLLPDTITSLDQFSKKSSYREEKDNWEKYFLVTQLEKNKWNISKTSKYIGLSRSHMNNLLKYHDLEDIVTLKKMEPKEHV